MLKLGIFLFLILYIVGHFVFYFELWSTSPVLRRFFFILDLFLSYSLKLFVNCSTPTFWSAGRAEINVALSGFEPMITCFWGKRFTLMELIRSISNLILELFSLFKNSTSAFLRGSVCHLDQPNWLNPTLRPYLIHLEYDVDMAAKDVSIDKIPIL